MTSERRLDEGQAPEGRRAGGADSRQAKLVPERLHRVRERIAAAAARAGRPAAAVRLVAVAKTATPAGLRAAWEAGQRDFGHNRIQWLERDRRLLPEARWHAIGPLQGNKVRRAVAAAALLHAVGEARTASRIQRAAEALDRQAVPILVQVNLTPEDGRYGCRREELAPLLRELVGLDRLRPRGLMTLAPQGAPEDVLRRHFGTLRELAMRYAGEGLLPEAPELSMGMTEDFEVAVEEGATLVRVGRAVFPLSDPHRAPDGT